jgi:hypothetical protein
MNTITEFYNIINNTHSNDNENNICLITSEPLLFNYIILDCGHKFNYEAIYNEVYNQQTLRLQDNKYLKKNEIKCPYCRVITNYTLPYYKYYRLDKYMSLKKMDQYNILKNPNYKGAINQCVNITNCKRCENFGCIELNTAELCYCNRHNKNIYSNILDINDLINNPEYIHLSKFTRKYLCDILKNNNSKYGGNKRDLIIRIMIEKSKNIEWKE